MNIVTNDQAKDAITGKKTPRRCGRPFAIDEAAEREICAILAMGGSIRDAADYCRISRRTILNHRKRSRSFCQGLNQASAQGKILLLRKIAKAPQWQAAAWMLERRWPEQFARRQHIDLKSTETPTVTRIIGVDVGQAFPPMPNQAIQQTVRQ